MSSPQTPAPEARTQPTPRESRSRALSLLAATLLALLCVGWGWAEGSPLVGLLKALPLLPAGLGLWRYRLYTFRWVSLLVWCYALEGLVHAASSAGLSRGLGVLETALALLLFAAATAHIRWRLSAARAAGRVTTPAAPQPTAQA